MTFFLSIYFINVTDVNASQIKKNQVFGKIRALWTSLAAFQHAVIVTVQITNLRNGIRV